MQQVEVLVEHARKNGGQQRLAAVAELKALANNNATQYEAVGALVRLWRESFATPADLTPYAATVLDIWKTVLESVKPFQRDTVTVEWVTEDEYSPVSTEAEAVLALLGHFPGEEIGQSLRDALRQVTDPSLKMCAVLSLLRRLDFVDPAEIEPIAAHHMVRIYLWNQLRDLGMESLMPAQWAAPDALAASDLSRWLSHPNELNAIPEEVELVRVFPVAVEDGCTENVYLFRFREFPKPWEPGAGWMAGIAGRCRGGEALGSPWSAFRRWDSMSPEEHFNDLYYRC